jgi:peptidoglycan/LPS O-acetylase OafA/YrhL
VPLFGTIQAFIPGMIALLIGHRLIERLPSQLAPAAFMFAVVGFIGSRRVLGGAHWPGIAEGIFGACLVAFAAFGRIGLPGSFLDLKPVRFFGRISYSFYLLHPLTLIVLWNIPEQIAASIRFGVPPGIVGLSLFALSTAAITPLAWAMYYWVERPGVAAGRTLVSNFVLRFCAAADTPKAS